MITDESCYNKWAPYCLKEMNTMKIAFFDSGIGGLSVLHHAMKVMPHEQFIFFADEDNVPYGTKTKAQVFQYVNDAFTFLMTKDVKAIVVACNTATSVAVRDLRHMYSIPIIGMEPAAKKPSTWMAATGSSSLLHPLPYGDERLRNSLKNTIQKALSTSWPCQSS